MVQFGEKISFHKIGVEGINSPRKRRIQGIFVGHIMIEQEQFHTLPRVELCEAKVGQGKL